MSRRIIALIGVAAAAIVAVVVVLLLRGGDDKPAATKTQGDTRAEALSYAPRNAPALVGVDTGSAAASLVLGVVVPQVSGGALTANDVSPLLGNEAVVAILDQQRAQLSMVAKDPDALRALTRRLQSSGSYKGRHAVQGPRRRDDRGEGRHARRGLRRPDRDTGDRHRRRQGEAHHPAAVRPAPRRPADRRRHPGGLRPQAHRRRHAPPGRPQHPLGPVADERRRRARGGRPGLRLPFVLQTDAARINDQDLPFGTGTTPPQMRGRGPLLIAAKDFARLIAFLRKADPERLGGLDSLQSGLPGFLRINIDGLLGGLHGDGTVSSDDGLSHFAARTDPPDPGDWRTPLNRLSTLSSVLQRLGIDNIKLDEEPGDAYRLEIDGKLTARVGIFGPTVVITDDADTNLRATATAPVVPPPPGANGGLTLRLQASEGRRLLGGLLGVDAGPPEEGGLGGGAILARFGELTGWARAATDGVRGELDLGLR